MIADAIQLAQKMHRKALEETYDGVCTVYERKPQEDLETGDTVFREMKVQENIPCHLSYSSMPATGESDSGAAVTQTTRLLLAPEEEIKPGSRIEITQQGVTGSYSRSGKPAVYSSHQEIELVLFGGYA